MRAHDIGLAVAKVDADISTDLTAPELDDALRKVLPLLRVLWSDVPWWRKVIVGLGALLDAIREYLGEPDDA